jgi:hypothetical protein
VEESTTMLGTIPLYSQIVKLSSVKVVVTATG